MFEQMLIIWSWVYSSMVSCIHLIDSIIYESRKLWCVGRADLSELLAGMDGRIAEAKEHALSRKDILEKVEKWKSTFEEEAWLDEYERVHFFSSKSSFICLKLKNIAVLNLSCSNSCIQHIYPFQDHNRYNAGRGAHINLKRAEKARVLVSKIPCKLYTYLQFYLSLNCRAPRIILCVHYTRRLWYP